MRCYACMKTFEDGYSVCPHCGHDMDAGPVNEMHLKPGTLLDHGRFYIGLAVGNGGFGITYRAWDNQLDTKVAIKEFFPVQAVNRTQEQTEVNVYVDMGSYKEQLRDFVEEIKLVASCSNCENVVSVYEELEENGTAYMIMEFLEGITLKEWLAEQKKEDKNVPMDFALKITKSVGNALMVLHEKNLWHLDISPDNIMLLDGGEKIKLIDFGAAMVAGKGNAGHQCKPEYAPLELRRSIDDQRQSSGNADENGMRVGPWSDVYELSVTLYEMLTGVRPSPSADRVQDDDYESPRNCVHLADMPQCVEIALENGLAVHSKDRIQTVKEFLEILFDEKKALELKRAKKRKRTVTLALSIGLIAVAAVTIGLQFYKRMNTNALKTTLTVWVCAREGESEEELEKYYEDCAKESFCKDYQNVAVKVEAVPEAEYVSKLMTAAQEGNAPDVFESTNGDEQLLSIGMPLDQMVQEMLQNQTEKGEYYFFSDYKRYVPDGRSFPVGYTIPIAYSLQRDCPEKVTGDDLRDDSMWLEHGEGDSEEMDHFSQGECKYLVGDSTDYDRLQEKVYGTFDESKEDIAGKLNMAYVEDGEPEFTIAFSIWEGCRGEEKQAAELFLRYMVSYNEQVRLFGQGTVNGVEESESLPVNAKADQWYRSTYRNSLSVLDNVVKDYREK